MSSRLWSVMRAIRLLRLGADVRNALVTVVDARTVRSSNRAGCVDHRVNGGVNVHGTSRGWAGSRALRTM